jgi:quinol monooxygenase YgiN
MKRNLILCLLAVFFAGISCTQKSASTAPQPVIIKKMILAKVIIKPEKVDEFITAAQVIIENTHKEPGCLGYQLYQDPVKKTDFIFVESYKDQAAIDAHFAAPYFKEFGATIGGMTNGSTEIRIVDVCGEK